MNVRQGSVAHPHEPSCALVTGASSGIGRSFAHLLAAQGYHLIIAARRADRLLELKTELSQLYKTSVFVIAADLASLDSLREIKDLVAEHSLFIEILINNAGFGCHGPFSQTTLENELKMVTLQISTTIALSKMLLPAMVEKKRGGILNVGSIYSFMPVPYQSVYGGCKSFLLSFSYALAHEVKKSGVHVTALCPGTTLTEFRSCSKIKESEKITQHPFLNFAFRGMSADMVAKKGYDALKAGKLACIPGFRFKVMVFFACCLPVFLVSAVLSFINNLRGVNGNKGRN